MLPWLESSCRTLSDRIDAQRLGHAPLIHGPRGVGKQALADWLARRVMCNTPDAGEPCGSCQSCQLVDGGTHPDHFILDVPEDKQVIGVDQVRELIERLQLTASLGGGRVGLVPQADALNRNAANALLKTLEEPAPGAWLILVSETPARLPATIRSRCQQFPLRVPPRADGEAWLADACSEHADADRDAALSLSAGAPLAARDMLESGGLETGFAVLDDLGDGRGHGEVLERWQDDPAGSWQWIARWMSVLMAGESGAPGWRPSDRPLPGGIDRRRLAELWQMALEGYRECQRGVVRQDLLLGRWLLEWQSAQSVRN